MGQARIRFSWTAGDTFLAVSIERLADGRFADSQGGWVAPAGGSATAPIPPGGALPPSPPLIPLVESLAPGRYAVNLDATNWQDGQYCVCLHNARTGAAVQAMAPLVIRGGDDGPAFPPVGGTANLSIVLK